MATIRITRHNEYANKIRKIKILIDGNEYDSIANGESKEIHVIEGRHTLQAKIDWCSSNILTFDISDNDFKNFDLTSFAKHNSLGSFAAIYYITFGASKYLNLKEII